MKKKAECLDEEKYTRLKKSKLVLFFLISSSIRNAGLVESTLNRPNHDISYES